jgi:hypothetical protein
LACPRKITIIPKLQIFVKEYQYNLEKIKQELLKTEEQPKLLSPVQKLASKDLVTVDIAIIGAADFSRLCRYKENTVFTTSLYKINRLIEEKTSLLEKTLEQLVEHRLPAQYSDYKDVFSKTVSDQLVPY